MHCVSSYPAPEENLNLNTINTLRNKFKCSGVTAVMKIPSPSLRISLGASAIERHITLDRLCGEHQFFLAEPGIKNLVELLIKAKQP